MDMGWIELATKHEKIDEIEYFLLPRATWERNKIGFNINFQY